MRELNCWGRYPLPIITSKSERLCGWGELRLNPSMRVLHLCSTRVLRSPLPVHRARICAGRFSVQAAPPRLSTKPRRRSTHRPRLPPLPAKAAAVASRRPARNGPAGRAHRSSRWPHVPSIRGGLALAARRAPRARGLCSLNAKAGQLRGRLGRGGLAGWWEPGLD